MTSLITSALVMLALPYIFSGITVNSIWAALVAAFVLGVVNSIIKPLLQILTFPITFLTFGLFSFVINGAMIMMTSFFVSGFSVAGWWDAILAAIVLSLVTSVVSQPKKR